MKSHLEQLIEPLMAMDDDNSVKQNYTPAVLLDIFKQLIDGNSSEDIFSNVFDKSFFCLSQILDKVKEDQKYQSGPLCCRLFKCISLRIKSHQKSQTLPNDNEVKIFNSLRKKVGEFQTDPLPKVESLIIAEGNARGYLDSFGIELTNFKNRLNTFITLPISNEEKNIYSALNSMVKKYKDQTDLSLYAELYFEIIKKADSTYKPATGFFSGAAKLQNFVQDFKSAISLESNQFDKLFDEIMKNNDAVKMAALYNDYFWSMLIESGKFDEFYKANSEMVKHVLREYRLTDSHYEKYIEQKEARSQEEETLQVEIAIARPLQKKTPSMLRTKSKVAPNVTKAVEPEASKDTKPVEPEALPINQTREQPDQEKHPIKFPQKKILGGGSLSTSRPIEKDQSQVTSAIQIKRFSQAQRPTKPISQDNSSIEKPSSNSTTIIPSLLGSNSNPPPVTPKAHGSGILIKVAKPPQPPLRFKKLKLEPYKRPGDEICYTLLDFDVHVGYNEILKKYFPEDEILKNAGNSILLITDSKVVSENFLKLSGGNVSVASKEDYLKVLEKPFRTVIVDSQIPNRDAIPGQIKNKHSLMVLLQDEKNLLSEKEYEEWGYTQSITTLKLEDVQPVLNRTKIIPRVNDKYALIPITDLEGIFVDKKTKKEKYLPKLMIKQTLKAHPGKICIGVAGNKDSKHWVNIIAYQSKESSQILILDPKFKDETKNESTENSELSIKKVHNHLTTAGFKVTTYNVTQQFNAQDCGIACLQNLEDILESQLGNPIVTTKGEKLELDILRLTLNGERYILNEDHSEAEFDQLLIANREKWEGKLSSAYVAPTNLSVEDNNYDDGFFPYYFKANKVLLLASDKVKPIVYNCQCQISSRDLQPLFTRSELGVLVLNHKELSAFIEDLEREIPKGKQLSYYDCYLNLVRVKFYNERLKCKEEEKLQSLKELNEEYQLVDFDFDENHPRKKWHEYIDQKLKEAQKADLEAKCKQFNTEFFRTLSENTTPPELENLYKDYCKEHAETLKWIEGYKELFQAEKWTHFGEVVLAFDRRKFHVKASYQSSVLKNFALGMGSKDDGKTNGNLSSSSLFLSLPLPKNNPRPLPRIHGNGDSTRLNGGNGTIHDKDDEYENIGPFLTSKSKGNGTPISDKTHFTFLSPDSRTGSSNQETHKRAMIPFIPESGQSKKSEKDLKTNMIENLESAIKILNEYGGSDKKMIPTLMKSCERWKRYLKKETEPEIANLFAHITYSLTTEIANSFEGDCAKKSDKFPEVLVLKILSMFVEIDQETYKKYLCSGLSDHKGSKGPMSNYKYLWSQCNNERERLCKKLNVNDVDQQRDPTKVSEIDISFKP